MEKSYATLVDMEYVMEEVRKTNDRIQLLEHEVEELRNEKYDLLSNSEKEAVVEHQGKFTPTPNQKRDNIIWKAKNFIKEHQRSGMNMREFDFGIVTYSIKFRVKPNKRTVEGLLMTLDGLVRKRKKVTCHPDEVFNEYIGKAIVIGRLLGIDVSEFEDAPQPSEFVDGMIVKSKYNKGHKWRVENYNGRLGDIVVVHAYDNIGLGFKFKYYDMTTGWAIIDQDTDAEYKKIK